MAASAQLSAGMVGDINAYSGRTEIYMESVALNGAMLFVCKADGYGKELWICDGTAAGTRLVKDIYPGDYDPMWAMAPTPWPKELTVLNGQVLFSVQSPEYGEELWRSDGTEEGTVLVADLDPGASHSYPRYLTVVGDYLFFQANDDSDPSELWRTDGTTAGTVLVGEFPHEGKGGDPYIRALTPMGGQLYFQTGETMSTAMKLWKTDGTAAGTVMLYDGPFDEPSEDPSRFYYIHYMPMLPLGNELVFAMNITDYTEGLMEDRLMKTDGTPGSTSTIMTLAGLPWSTYSVVVDHRGFAWCQNMSTGWELWTTDGTEAGTSVVNGNVDLLLGSNISSTRVLNGIVYFSAHDGLYEGLYGTELWRTDGTEAGTYPVKDIREGSVGSGVNNMVILDGMLYFTADDGIHGNELWQSDGTEEGTVLACEMVPGPDGAAVRYPCVVGDNIFFNADDGVHGWEIWRTYGQGEYYPLAAFRCAGSLLVAGPSVSFYDESLPGAEPITHWHWDFGDGYVSEERNPTHEYEESGPYSVTLTVTTAVGSHQYSRSIWVSETVPAANRFGLTALAVLVGLAGLCAVRRTLAAGR